MTIDAWLRARSAEVPPQLAARIRASLGADVLRDARDLPAVCLGGAERLLGTIMANDGTRAEALDLLTVDALVTYAFEGAADTPETLPPAARDAMQRLAAHAAGGSA